MVVSVMQSNTGLVAKQDMVLVGLCQGLFSQLGFGSNMGNVLGSMESGGQGKQVMRSKAGDGTSEGLTGLAGALAVKSLDNFGISRMGSEGIEAGDEGIGMARRSQSIR